MKERRLLKPLQMLRVRFMNRHSRHQRILEILKTLEKDDDGGIELSLDKFARIPLYRLRQGAQRLGGADPAHLDPRRTLHEVKQFMEADLHLPGELSQVEYVDFLQERTNCSDFLHYLRASTRHGNQRLQQIKTVKASPPADGCLRRN